LLGEIGALFGREVQEILQDCLASDYRKIAAARSFGVHKKAVRQLPRPALVALADSIVMAVALHSDLIAHGSRAWNRYEESREDVLSHFEALAQTFGQARPGVLAAHFATIVSELVCAASPYQEEPAGSGDPLPFRPRIVSEDDQA
jgi:hypothetical protein